MRVLFGIVALFCIGVSLCYFKNSSEGDRESAEAQIPTRPALPAEEKRSADLNSSRPGGLPKERSKNSDRELVKYSIEHSKPENTLAKFAEAKAQNLAETTSRSTALSPEEMQILRQELVGFYIDAALDDIDASSAELLGPGEIGVEIEPHYNTKRLEQLRADLRNRLPRSIRNPVIDQVMSRVDFLGYQSNRFRKILKIKVSNHGKAAYRIGTIMGAADDSIVWKAGSYVSGQVFDESYLLEYYIDKFD